MEDFFKFKRMLTPVFIQILFWIGIILSLIGGLVSLAAGSARGDGGMIFSGLLSLILGPIIVRIWCEVLIVVFTINDTLTDIKNILQQRNL